LVVLGALTPTRALANTAVICDPAALVTAITNANLTAGDTLDLASGCTYTFATANNNTDLPGTATPVITSNITINGNGDTVTRSTSASTAFRLFDVGSGGTLTLNNTTVSNGSALGNGGGILDSGALTLSGDTIFNNTGSGVNQILGSAGLTATNTSFASNTQHGLFNQGSGLDTLVSVNSSNNTFNGVLSNGPITMSGGSITGNGSGVQTVNPSAASNTITISDSSLSNNTNFEINSSGAASVTRTTISNSPNLAVSSQGTLTMNTVSLSGVSGFGLLAALSSGSTSLTGVNLTTSSVTSAVITGPGPVTVTGSKFTNTGAVAGNGIITGGGPAQITGSTVSGFVNELITGGATTVDSSTITTGVNGIITGFVTAVTNSTVSGFTNGIIVGPGASTIAGTTVTNNTNLGIVGSGGVGNSLAVTRSTVSNSTKGVIAATSVTGSTVTGNSTFGVVGATTVTDSIVSANGGTNCSGVTDAGHNINFPASDATCPATFTQGDPKLDILRDNGGPTQTMALLDGSAAAGLTTVGATGCTAPDTDQRGVPRLQNGQPCDAGAFELDSTSTTVAASATSLTAGQTLSLASIVTPFSFIPGAPSGTLSFFNGSTLIATVPLTNGHAAFGSATLPVGTYTVIATFPGARGFLASSSAPVTVTISPPVPSVGAAQELPSPVTPVLLILSGLGLAGAVWRPRRR
jgi:hypothetical protein